MTIDVYRQVGVLRAMLVERGYARRTVIIYGNWAVRFLDHCRAEGVRPGNSSAARFLSRLAIDLDVSLATQRQAHSALRFFFGQVLGTPLPDGAAPVLARRTSRAPHLLDAAGALTLFRALDDPYRLVAQLIFGAGLLLQEALALRVSDFDAGLAYVHAGAVTGRWRSVPLPPWLGPPLRDQLVRVVCPGDNQSSLLFPSPRAHDRARDHPPLHLSTFQKQLRRAARAAGLPPITGHDLRDSYAVALLRGGCTPEVVRRRIGLRRARSLARYLALAAQPTGKGSTPPALSVAPARPPGQRDARRNARTCRRQ